MGDPIAEFVHWYRRRPIVTKIFLTLSTLMAISLSLEILSINTIFYTYIVTFNTLELWRPLTSLIFLSQFDLFFIAKAYLVYNSLISAELDIFKKQNMADFWVLLIYIFCMLTIFGAIVDVYFLIDGFVMALIYIWSKYKPFSQIVLVFEISISSYVYPWVYFGFAVLLGRSFYVSLAGILIGHLYIYLKGTFLGKYNIDLIKTPAILKRVARLYYQQIKGQNLRRPQRQDQSQQMREDDDANYQ